MVLASWREDSLVAIWFKHNLVGVIGNVCLKIQGCNQCRGFHAHRAGESISRSVFSKTQPNARGPFLPKPRGPAALQPFRTTRLYDVFLWLLGLEAIVYSRPSQLIIDPVWNTLRNRTTCPNSRHYFHWIVCLRVVYSRCLIIASRSRMLETAPTVSTAEVWQRAVHIPAGVPGITHVCWLMLYIPPCT